MKRDPRITAKHLTLKSYLLVFLLMAFLCGATLTIYTAQMAQTDSILIAALSMAGYVLFLSGAACGIFALYRRRVVMRPVLRLSEAARKVAKGDFTVRLSPMRKDGAKDEFEVLFDDFNTMAEELGSTETLKADFVANVSHEMKTPLAVLQNYAELLQTPDLSEEQRMEYAAAVKGAAGRMALLVSNILRLNRLENQKIVPNLTQYDLCRQIADCILQYETRWEAKGLELEADLEDSAPIYADESLLELVWNNLLSNAVKFTEPGGVISVTERRDGDRIVVSVWDTGCGMSEEQVRHIFDKFYQGDTSHATEGNGLGLALVRRVMDLTGGEIRVESKEGKGSVFTVTLGGVRPVK